MVEMTETANILNNATKSSLVLLMKLEEAQVRMMDYQLPGLLLNI